MNSQMNAPDPNKEPASKEVDESLISSKATGAKRKGRTRQEMIDRATEPEWYGVTSF